MKKNLFLISENEKERILQMHRSATRKSYIFEQTEVPLQPKDVLGFQQYVINQLGDKTILGKGGPSGFGDDGKYGPKTTAAWAKYGKDYNDKYAGQSPQQAINNTAVSRSGWLNYKCITDVGTENVSRSGYVYYKLSPGYVAIWDPEMKKPALVTDTDPKRFVRFLTCEDQSLAPEVINANRTKSDRTNWQNWACVTSVGKENLKGDGWVRYDFPDNKYAYFDDKTKKPALGDYQTKQKIRDLECTDEILKQTTASTATTATTLVGLTKLSPDMQKNVTTWSQSPAGQYILSLAPEQREAGLDNLEKRRGDQTTRNLKNEIRIALGMAADNLGGRIKQAVQGARQGFAGK